MSIKFKKKCIGITRFIVNLMKTQFGNYLKKIIFLLCPCFRAFGRRSPKPLPLGTISHDIFSYTTSSSLVVTTLDRLSSTFLVRLDDSGNGLRNSLAPPFGELEKIDMENVRLRQNGGTTWRTSMHDLREIALNFHERRHARSPRTLQAPRACSQGEGGSWGSIPPPLACLWFYFIII